MIDVNPFLGIYAATTRKTDLGNLVGKDEAVSILDAIRAYTATAAYACFVDNQKGVIKPGMRADLTIQNKNLLALEAEDLLNVKADLTMINGEIVYQRSPNA